MATFKIFSEDGSNLLSNANFEVDSDVVNGFQPNTTARSIAMNSYLKSVGVVCEALAKYCSTEGLIGPETDSTTITLLQPFEFKQDVQWSSGAGGSQTTHNCYNLLFPSTPTTFKARFVCNAEIDGSSTTYVLGYKSSSTGSVVQLANGSLSTPDLFNWCQVVIEVECMDDTSKALYIRVKLVHKHGEAGSYTLDEVVNVETIYDSSSYGVDNRFSFYMSFTRIDNSTAYITGSSKTPGITFSNTTA